MRDHCSVSPFIVLEKEELRFGEIADERWGTRAKISLPGGGEIEHMKQNTRHVWERNQTKSPRRQSLVW